MLKRGIHPGTQGPIGAQPGGHALNLEAPDEIFYTITSIPWEAGQWFRCWFANTHAFSIYTYILSNIIFFSYHVLSICHILSSLISDFTFFPKVDAFQGSLFDLSGWLGSGWPWQTSRPRRRWISGNIFLGAKGGLPSLRLEALALRHFSMEKGWFLASAWLKWSLEATSWLNSLETVAQLALKIIFGSIYCPKIRHS